MLITPFFDGFDENKLEKSRIVPERLVLKTNKPGTAQVGAISKAQKRAKGLQSVKYSLLQNPNEEKSCQNFFSNFFEVSCKSHSAEKCKRGAFRDFSNIHSVAK